jgi:hypothetical protein
VTDSGREMRIGSSPTVVAPELLKSHLNAFSVKILMVGSFEPSKGKISNPVMR